MIRNIKIEDYHAIDNLLVQLHRVHVEGRPELFVDLEHFMSEESFACLVTDDEIISILAEKNRKIVGCCFASMLNHSGMVQMKTAYVDELVVDEKYRRQGIGEALFRAAGKRAKKMGAKRIDLMVWSCNDIAINAYESYGMTPQRFIYEKAL